MKQSLTPIVSGLALGIVLAVPAFAQGGRQESTNHASPPPPLPAKGGTPSSTQDNPTQLSQEQIQLVALKVRPSLVRIRVVSAYPESGRETKEEGFGSGAIISSDGYVVTNHHVVGDARWLSVTLSNKEEVEARLIGTDPLADIAVIKLAPSPDGPYPAIAWGDSSKLRVGDAVLAMGSPRAFSQSVTAGIVSNTELIMPQFFREELTMAGEDVGSIVRWIAHDAQIFPGNSGGPLVSLDGTIVGINEIGVGLSGAIPGNLARDVANQLIAKGSVTRAFTGLNIQPRLRSQKMDHGALVGGVLSGSPAASAGIKAGDILLKVGNRDIDAHFSEQVPLANLELYSLPVDKATPFEILRDGKPMTLNVTPTIKDAAEARSVEMTRWGMTCSDITLTMAREQRLDSGVRGVLVTSIMAGGPVGDAKPPIAGDDIIISVAGEPVPDMAAFRAVTEKIPSKDGGTPTLVEVRRDGQQLLTVVQVGRKTEEDTSVEAAKSWLPIDVQAVTPQLAQALKLPPNTRGVRVTQIYTDASPAVAAKFKIGDIFTKMDGMPIPVADQDEVPVFFSTIRQYRIGITTKLTGLRAGMPLTVTVPTVRAPLQDRELPRFAIESLGLTVRSVGFKDRFNLRTAPDEGGALVVEITPGGWAALSGLRQGDIIRSIDGVPVNGAAAASTRLKEIDQQKPKSITLFVARGIQTQYIEIQTDYSLTVPK